MLHPRCAPVRRAITETACDGAAGWVRRVVGASRAAPGCQIRRRSRRAHLHVVRHLQRGAVVAQEGHQAHGAVRVPLLHVSAGTHGSTAATTTISRTTDNAPPFSANAPAVNWHRRYRLSPNAKAPWFWQRKRAASVPVRASITDPPEALLHHGAGQLRVRELPPVAPVHRQALQEDAGALGVHQQPRPCAEDGANAQSKTAPSACGCTRPCGPDQRHPSPGRLSFSRTQALLPRTQLALPKRPKVLPKRLHSPRTGQPCLPARRQRRRTHPCGCSNPPNASPPNARARTGQPRLPARRQRRRPRLARRQNHAHAGAARRAHRRRRRGPDARRRVEQRAVHVQRNQADVAAPRPAPPGRRSRLRRRLGRAGAVPARASAGAHSNARELRSIRVLVHTQGSGTVQRSDNDTETTICARVPCSPCHHGPTPGLRWGGR